MDRKQRRRGNSDKTSKRTDKCVEEFVQKLYRPENALKPRTVSKLKTSKDFYTQKLKEQASNFEELQKRIIVLEVEKNAGEIPAAIESDKEQLVKYAGFLQSKLKKAPKLEKIVLKRVDSLDNFTEKLRRGSPQCLLPCAQILSDLLLKEISSNEESPGLSEIINNQPSRIKQLSREISETMIAGKQLLCSPLARSSSHKHFPFK